MYNIFMHVTDNILREAASAESSASSEAQSSTQSPQKNLDQSLDKHTDKRADEKLFQSVLVLDKGFVRLVDYMGSDARIVQSARVSYGAGTKTYREDRALIRYLLRNAHTSPFEQVVFSFHIKMPIFVARQWVRHRTARMNEISARYSLMPDEFYVPAGEDINAQSENNKQARADEPLPVEVQEHARRALEGLYEESYKTYTDLLDKNIAREVARIALPTALYTEMYWQIDLHNLFHFLRLRMDAHAQKEIRDYAQAMFAMVREICPLACEAFEDFVLHKVELYRGDCAALSRILAQCNIDEARIEEIAVEAGIDGKQERARFVQKVRALLDGGQGDAAAQKTHAKN